ncbi:MULTISPECIES: DUF1064 domain-containing protein [Ralstonia]|nr:MULTISPECIES: DUF1064 domain-containing protein [Ralstonia]MBL4778421.1 DUF1064 domain-containing protein [Ralstonia sp.]
MADANGRAIPARVRGAHGSQVAGAGNSRLPAVGGKAPRAAGSGSPSLRRPKGPAGAPGKYGNKRVEFEGLMFDSLRELARYQQLKVLQVSGAISQLRCQVPFELAPGVVINGRRRPPLRYVADFVYREKGSPLDTIEDVKGAVTEAYRIKRHLMVAAGFVIKEIR